MIDGGPSLASVYAWAPEQSESPLQPQQDREPTSVRLSSLTSGRYYPSFSDFLAAIQEVQDALEMPVEEIDGDFAILAKLCSDSEPADEDQLERALHDAHSQAKDQVRRQMGLA